MSLSEEFLGLVCGILIGLFVLLLETEPSRDRDTQQQEQSAKKRGPEENDDQTPVHQPIKTCLLGKFVSSSPNGCDAFNKKPSSQPLQPMKEPQRGKTFLPVFADLPQKITCSEEFYQGLVCDIVIALLILWLQTDTSRDRNNHQQEQRAKKRGPEENDDNIS